MVGAALAALLLLACADAAPRSNQKPVVPTNAERPSSGVDVLRLVPRVLASYPHDPGASTQGLLFHEDWLYESTGLWGQSSLRRVDLSTGRVVDRVDLEQSLFGEGLARVGNSLVQLTWQSGEAIRYEVESFSVLMKHSYEGEGWGLCHDGHTLWRSDGTDVLRRHDPTTFEQVGRLEVRIRSTPVDRLNELECAEGWIYANVWQSDEIVRIDPATGKVLAVVDASGLLDQGDRSGAGVLNGIAYREATGSFFLTGKNWPRLFEVVFVEAARVGGVTRPGPRS